MVEFTLVAGPQEQLGLRRAASQRVVIQFQFPRGAGWITQCHRRGGGKRGHYASHGQATPVAVNGASQAGHQLVGRLARDGEVVALQDAVDVEALSHAKTQLRQPDKLSRTRHAGG